MSPALTTARICAEIALRSYSEETIFHRETDTHILVTDSPIGRVLAPRGTNSLRNWITDAEFKMIRYPSWPGKIHAGFQEAASSVISDVLDAVPPASDIIVVGHSLGGALASLIAYRLDCAGRSVKQVVTFGQPRTGNDIFRDAYNLELGNRTWRWVHEEDIVPRLPGVLMGYRHVGQECFLDSDGGLDLNPSLLTKLASDISGIVSAGFKGIELAIEDHFMPGYIRRLETIKL